MFLKNEKDGNMTTMRNWTFSIIFGGLAFLLSGLWASAAGLEADMVILNGKILTADSPDPTNFTIAQAAAIYDGKFIVVGSNQDALEYAGPNTRQIDVGGRTVIPGLVETHDHIYGYGSHFFPEGKPQIEQQLPPIVWSNEADFLAQIRTVALTKRPGEWIVTVPTGARQDFWPVELTRGDVTRFDLDQAAPDNPLYLHWKAMEEALVNTKALEALLERYPDIRGVVRDDQGVPTGRLKGLANNTVRYEFWPQLPPAEIGPYYKLEMEEVAAQGVTTLSTRLHPQHLAAYAWLNARGELPQRLAFSLETTNRNPNVHGTMSRLVGLQGGSGENMWGIGGNMMWIIGMALSNIDGIPGTGASCISKTYPRESPNFPLWLHQFYGPNGMCTLKDPEFNDIEQLRAAAKYGFRISAMHSGGDRGIELFLSTLEELSKQYPDLVERRWVIDHCRFITDEHAQRAKKLGLIFSCGPKYVYAGEKGDIGVYKVLYGEKMAEDVVVPLRRLLDLGLRTTMQLDQHGFHAFLALEVAVNRLRMSTEGSGGRSSASAAGRRFTCTRAGALSTS